jgi:ATP-dependent RNA helicase DeaD
VHRIGRTGRAGRSGEAILFVAPRERHLLRAIERATRQQIELMELPSAEMVNDKRIAKFTQRITDTLATRDLEFFREIITRYQQQHDADAVDIAAALAMIAQGDKPLLVKDVITREKAFPADKPASREKKSHRDDDRGATLASRGSSAASREPRARSPRATAERLPPGTGIDVFRVEVGRSHGMEARNLVGAIANEAGVASAHIGRIEIFDEYSTVELPEGMPKDIFKLLKKVWVSGQQLQISRLGGAKGGAKRGLQDEAKPSKIPPRATKRNLKGGKS